MKLLWHKGIRNVIYVGCTTERLFYYEDKGCFIAWFNSYETYG